MAEMTIIDDLRDEAEYLQRQESNLTKLVEQHRKSLFNVLNGRPCRESVKQLIDILAMTDFKGYFRDKHG